MCSCFPHLCTPFPCPYFLPPDVAPQVLWASVSTFPLSYFFNAVVL